MTHVNRKKKLCSKDNAVDILSSSRAPFGMIDEVDIHVDINETIQYNMCTLI